MAAKNPEVISDCAKVTDHITEDAKRIRAMFPVEVWLLVFSCLEDPEDLKCVSNASLEVRNMLQRRKVEYLFPTVWDIVGVRLHLDKKWNTAEDGVGPRGYGALLGLRLVSRAWKNALNEFYVTQALPPAFARKGSKFAQVGSLLQDTYWNEHFHSGTPGSIRNFQEHFGNTHHHENGESKGNSFVARAVCFYFSRCDDDRFLVFQRAASELLRAYGNNISICEFVLIQNSAYITARILNTLPQLLSYLPNLTCLNIQRIRSRRHMEQDVDIEENLISGVGYPHLPKLEKLEYLSLSGATPVVANPFLQSYKHVSILNFHPRIVRAGAAVIAKPFPNLTDLAITCHNIADFLALSQAQFCSTFSFLEVNFDMPRPHLSEIFALLANKWKSLKRLKLVFPFVYTVAYSERERIEEEIKNLQQQYFPQLERRGREMCFELPIVCPWE